jgi:hypothetical protein
MNTNLSNITNAIINTFNSSNANSLQLLLTTKTNQPVAAKFKNAVNVTKISVQNVTIHKSSLAYLQSVQANASTIQDNEKNADNVSNFIVSPSKLTHLPDLHCLAHNTNDVLLLCCFLNSSSSNYYVNDILTTKQDVLQYFTPSKQQQLLSNVTHNKTNDVLHNIKYFTIFMHNIQSIQFIDNTIVGNAIVNDDFIA